MKEKSCGCIIIDDGKILMVKENKGHWGFPKGHVEEGETEFQTAMREVKEETNIDVEIDENSKRYTITYVLMNGNEKEAVYFIAKKVGGNIIRQESEINTIEWVDVNNVADTITFNNLRELFNEVRSDLKI